VEPESLGFIGTVLIGPNALLRDGVAHILTGADFRILASAAYIDDSIATLLVPLQAILLIIEASDFDATLGQIETFKEQCPAGRVVVLAHQLHLPEMVLAFSAGADAYLVNVARTDTFIKFLELVMLGERILPPSLLNLFYANESSSDSGNVKLDHQDSDKPDDPRTNGNNDPSDDNDSDGEDTGKLRLSPRQRLILRYLIEGDPNKIIARKVHITEGTVKTHVKTILRKIRVHNRTQAAFWAVNNGSFMLEGQNHSSAVPPQNLVTEQVPRPAQNSAPPSSHDFKIEGAHNGPVADTIVSSIKTFRKHD
jgi:two-component system nitrate/nitrite response regulator NarL